ncbi:MAG TPA: hypothetical protein VFB19_15310 [Mycobacterium sp.]|nr:hypothetical protein [Mycobacterium sp.]
MLIAELVTAAVFLGQSRPVAASHTMRLVDRGAPAGLAARLTDEFGGAVDAVSAFWGNDWPREVVVVITGTDADFAAQTGEPSRNWAGVAAVAVADRVDPARHQAFGQRIVFAPGANTMTEAALRIVLRHELFHYASRADTAFDAPRWLVEGVADYVARPPAPRPVTMPAWLPTDAELDSGGAAESAAYDQAWRFAQFVADRYGPAVLRRLYVDACGPGHPDASTAVRDTLGIALPPMGQP